MVIVIESLGIAAVQAASVLAAALASTGLRPLVQIVSPTSAQALALRTLAQQFDIEVAGAAGARAATLMSPRIVAARLGTVPAVAGPGIVHLTCREDRCHAAGTGGWDFTYESLDRVTVHCPAAPPPHALGPVASDHRAAAFAADVVRRHAMRILARQATPDGPPSSDVPGFVSLGQAALAVLGALEIRAAVPARATSTGSAPRRPRRRLAISTGPRLRDREARRDQA